MRRSRKRLGGGVAVMLAAALVLSACGDDDDDDAGGPASAGPAPSGTPIELGFANTENSPAGSYPDSRVGMEAAVEYVNSELGGVNGRPLAVEACITDASPESSIGCANKFVQAKKLAVIPGLDLGAPGAMKVYAEAGMPYVGGLQVSAEEYAMPFSFAFTGGAPAAVLGLAAYAGQDLQAKKVAIMGPDIPQASAAIDNFMKPVLGKLGATVTTVLESATAADFTPAVTRANQGDPDVLVMLYGGPTCTKVMQAVKQVNIATSKVLYSQECASEEIVSGGGGGGDNAIYNSPFLSAASDDPNIKIYRDKMEEYAPDGPISVSSQSGFNTIMTIYALLKKGDPAAISQDTLIGALKATNNEPGFISHPFTCDGQQFPQLTGLCDTNTRILKYENGEFVETNNQWVDGVAILTGG